MNIRTIAVRWWRRRGAVATSLAASLFAVTGNLPAATAPTAVLTPELVIQRVEAANATLTSWTAAYQQRRHYVHFGQTETRQGRMSFKRGVGFRLDVTQPDELVVIRKGEALQWRPKTKQLNVYHLQEGTTGAEALPIPLPVGGSNWRPADDHVLRIVESPDPEVVLEMTPKSEGSTYQKKTIWFDRQTWLPVKLQLVETTDDVVYFVFSDVVRNGKLADTVFEFARPADAEVIEHTELPKLDL